MATRHDHLDLKPVARAATVEELVAHVRRGLIRVPHFQRGLQWKADDVVQLFDSIDHGYPIGSLLFQKAHADAAQLKMGPLTIDAPESHEALWVVDGQQRLTALTATLARPIPEPMSDDDVWSVFFDARERTFQSMPRDGSVPDTWVPVSKLLDGAELSEWVFTWPYREDAELRGAVFQAGARIRRYEVPMYVVETDDAEMLKQIFFRINKSGKSLNWSDVHDALFGGAGEHPSTLPDLASELAKLGMGRPEKDQLLTCLIAFRGLDVTRDFAEHYRKRQDDLTDSVPDALPVIRRVLSFLKLHAEIPHLRLLPRTVPLVVLTRVFAVFPEPRARTLHLLTRWTWRSLLNAPFYEERTVLRRGVAVVSEGDEEEVVQRLLETIPSEQRARYTMPDRFDARAADSRLALLGMASLAPHDLDEGKPVDIPGLIEARDAAAFRRVLPLKGRSGSSPANRLIAPGHGSAKRQLLDVAAYHSVDSPILRSHGIDAEGAALLIAARDDEFLARRKTAIEEAVATLGTRLAGWEQTDRPSIAYILATSNSE